MIYDAVSYQQNRSGWPVFGGVVLLHGVVLAGMLNYQSVVAKPEMTAATPMTVRWVTPAEEPKPELKAEPQPVAEPEPLTPPPEVKKTVTGENETQTTGKTETCGQAGTAANKAQNCTAGFSSCSAGKTGVGNSGYRTATG